MRIIGCVVAMLLVLIVYVAMFNNIYFKNLSNSADLSSMCYGLTAEECMDRHFPSHDEITKLLSNKTFFRHTDAFGYSGVDKSISYFDSDDHIYTWYGSNIYLYRWSMTPFIYVMRYQNRLRIAIIYDYCHHSNDPAADEDGCIALYSEKILFGDKSSTYMSVQDGDPFHLSTATSPPFNLLAGDLPKHGVDFQTIMQTLATLDHGGPR
jgi:hypothetical protein